ncbi:MAG: NAD+ synthase [Anaerolineales bacterium]|nr:MAG: NAD+ synthase [Anaerolineales bacterium]
MSDHNLTLEINTDLATRILTDFIRTEIQRAGFERAVIGVSGGVDSALSCILTAQALGPKNVLALFMPYRSSAPESRQHAQSIIKQAGVQSEIVEITPMADPLLADIPEDQQVRRGNIMARMRMTILYDRSAAFKGLVVGTGNKTEILLGYTTLYGDSACAINPLGDLYKTQVRQLARSLDIPDEIIDKPPSADLWVGQTDEDDLGFTYDQVDRLLLLMVDGRYDVDACVTAGFKREFTELVLHRIRSSQYKRLMPPIAKLSNRTVGYDFLYLRDWGT